MRFPFDLRKKLAWTGFCVLLADLIFFLIFWRNIRVSDPCRQRSLGIELGLLLALIAFTLSLFGIGWKRLTFAAGAVLASYLWFSWLLWMVQIC